MNARAGADVDHVVGGQDRILVVLDHDYGVAEVAQVFQRFEQPRIIALMQPDGRLVQHVEHAGEAGADLRSEADALAFTAGERAGGARKREIIEADIDEELQPLADLLEDAGRDFLLLRREGGRDFRKPLVRLADRHVAHLADVLAADLHRERLRFEAIAVAGVARVVALVARQLLADPLAVRLPPAPLDVVDHALERLRRAVAAHAVFVGERDLLAAGAVKDHVLHPPRQLLPRRGHVDLVVAGDGFERLLVVGRGVAGARPRIDRAIAQGERAVGHDEVGLELQLRAEAVAFRAGAGGRVEREQPRLDLVDGEAGDGAGEPGGERDALVRLVLVAEDITGRIAVGSLA